MGVALDKCYICPPTGYGYDGETLICDNCSAPIEVGTVGSEGGCNPKVISYNIEDNLVQINADEMLIVWNE